jgi:hypothetical protein
MHRDIPNRLFADKQPDANVLRTDFFVISNGIRKSTFKAWRPAGLQGATKNRSFANDRFQSLEGFQLIGIAFQPPQFGEAKRVRQV